MLPNEDKVILYVDDETTALKYFSQLFGDQFRIETKPTGEEAWEFIEENAERVAVMVTDQRMAAVTGVELMERARLRYPNIVRILVTAFTQLDYAVQSVNEGGAFRYLTKPIHEEEMVGTLLRACEFHEMMVERDRLIREKLSTLNRLIVMDRIRGLSSAIAAMSGQFRNAWPAFLSYIEQSPIERCLDEQSEELADLDLMSVAKQESRQMIEAVHAVVGDVVCVRNAEVTDFDVKSFIESVIADQRELMKEDEIGIELKGCPADSMKTDGGTLRRAIEILFRRLSDVQDKPSTIVVNVSSGDQEFSIEIRGNFRGLDDAQTASFYSAVIPIRRWPIGMDMDVLGAFLLVHHLGGKLRVESQPPSGPGFRIQLPKQFPTDQEPATPHVTDEWFSRIHRSLSKWGLE